MNAVLKSGTASPRRGLALRGALGVFTFACATSVGLTARANPPLSLAHVEITAVRQYAPPPRGAEPIMVEDDGRTYEPRDPPEPPSRELYRSPMRLHIGPMGVTTGRSLGLGMGIAADFGRGSVGFRMSAAWMRGESGDPARAPSPMADGLAQYTGELTLDFHKRGPVHPVFGLGFGLAHINRGDGAGNVGIGTARFGLEYAIALDDADVRLGGGIMGVLPGPADREVADVRGYAIIGASLGIGF